MTEVAPSPPRVHSQEFVGTLSAIGAYTLWGLVPIYWPLIENATPLEILAHRVLWTLVFVVGLLFLTRRWGQVRQALVVARIRWLLALATVLVTINWGVFIWAVTNGFVLQSSLGYFINPLISVLLGVLIFRERLRFMQWVAVAAGALGVLVLTAGYGSVPWVALALACSFGLYGMVKKKAGVDAIPSLAIETGYSAPIALGFLGWLAVSGAGSFWADGPAQSLLLAGAGVVTAVPLLLFGAAAIRIPLSRLGILQYIGPALQFLLGLFVFGEEMTSLRWVGFVTVWLALGLFTADALNHQRHLRSARRAVPPL